MTPKAARASCPEGAFSLRRKKTQKGQVSRRRERIASLIRNTIGEVLLSRLSDPRIDPVSTSITRVEVSEDLLTARVYVSIMGTAGKQKRALQGLRHASGHIQELMMRKISLRNTPILEFELDVRFKKTLETLTVIEQAMEEIRQKEDRQEDLSARRESAQ